MNLLIVNPNTNKAITDLIALQADRVAGAGTEIRAGQPGWGPPSIETAVDAHVAAIALLDLVASEQADFDGLVVAAFSDPGIDALREVLDVPVVGIGEAALAKAAQYGSFAVLTVAPTSLGLVRGAVERLGLAVACSAVECLPLSVADAADPARIVDDLGAGGERILAVTGARALVLGGGPLGVHAAALEARLGVPVIDPVSAAVEALEEAVRTRPRGNRGIRPDQLPARAFAGDYDFLPRLETLLWPEGS